MTGIGPQPFKHLSVSADIHGWSVYADWLMLFCDPDKKKAIKFAHDFHALCKAHGRDVEKTGSIKF